MQKKSTVNDLPAVVLDCPVFGLKRLKKAGLLYTIMKVTLIQMTVAMIFSGVSIAFENHAQEILKRKVSLELKDISLMQALSEIEKAANVKFVYSPARINLDEKISLDVSKQKLGALLSELLTPRSIKFKVQEGDDYIVLIENEKVDFSLLPLADPVKAEIILATISGKVSDAAGNPMPGVNIIEKGTTNGTTTDVNGIYSLAVLEDDAVLVFSFIGYTTQEVAVSGRSVIDVVLIEDVQHLEEVVVVGYGTKSKKEITTSITSMDSKQMEELPITTIADAFSGQISGVIAESGTGAPGALPVLRIRGYGSINAGSEPLIVIDGMMASSSLFASLNPKSIERVDFLKDAAAGAIYGSRAGNGVIIITTKKGKYGEAKFSFNATYGLQEVTNKVDVLDRDDWLSLVKEAYSNDGVQLTDFYNRDASYFANTNWQDEIFRISPYQNYQFSAAGGSDKVQYYLAANILDNAGIILTTYSKTFSSNGNIDIELNPKLKVGLTYNAAYTKQRVNNSISGFGHGGGGYGISGGIIQQGLWFAPIIPVYTENGDYGQHTQGEFAPYFPKGYGNPVANLKETHDLYSKNNVMGRLYLNYEPIKGLSLNSGFSGDLYSYFRDWHVSPHLSGSGSPFANFSNPVYEKIRAEQQNSMSTSWTAETYIDYRRTIANNHDFDFIVGYSMQYNGNRSTSASSSANDRGSANAANPIPPYDNYFRPNIYGAALVLGGGGFGENAFQSIFSRLHYSYKDKYLFMGSIRRDGSSKFAPGERWGIFPAISGGWRISQEPFMEKFSWVDEFKLRMSYGVSGNDQFGNYAWQGNVSYGNLYTYGDPASGSSGTGISLIPSSIENSNLKWEVNEQINIGTDISVFGDRINLTADYFIRNTKDMLLYRSLPLENGITSTLFDNIGNMVNKGFELALNTVNVTSKDFTWRTNVNFTKTNNKVGDVFTSTGEIRYGIGFPGAGTIRIIEGRPLFEIYSWNTIGNFETQEQLDSYPGFNSPRIGDTMIEDYNDDGVINDNDMQPMGKVLPDFIFGFTNTLKYKNFDLSVIIYGNQGASKVIPALRQAGLLRSAENTLQLFYDNRYRVEEAHDLDLAFPTTGYSGPRHSNVSYFIYDASFIRIKNIVFGYNVPENIYSKIRFNGVRLTLGVQNLHTFTTYPLYNPEANTNQGASGTAQFGVDNGAYPLSRIYTIGLNLNF